MDRKYQIDTEENRQFLKKGGKCLLAFGRQFPSPGGSSYYLGDDGTPWKEQNRETYVTARMAHVYSIGKLQGEEGSGQLAEAAVRGLLEELKDKENGGWYTGLKKDGSILPGKLCYAHAFVILAGSSAVLAEVKGGEQLLTEALKVYDEKFWDVEEGLARDNWNTEFTVCDEYRGLNANMHSVEAFLAAADVLEEEQYRIRAGQVIRRVLDWAAGNDYRIPEHYSSAWIPEPEKNKEKPEDPFKPYGATPGHGIEWARLIVQWAVSTYGKEGEETGKYLRDAERLFHTAVSDAWNRDGVPGIAYTTDWQGVPVVKDRMHWTLAEAINTSAVLYRCTGKRNYGELYAEFLRYLDEKVLDHSCGSWFHQLDENNRLKTSVWPGKPDLYHAFQAMLIPCLPVEKSIAAAVSSAVRKTEGEA